MTNITAIIRLPWVHSGVSVHHPEQADCKIFEESMLEDLLSHKVWVLVDIQYQLLQHSWERWVLPGKWSIMRYFILILSAKAFYRQPRKLFGFG